MSKVKLIDTLFFKPQNLILENKNSNSGLVVEGPLATANKPNGNGRYYSKEIWEREINKYIGGPVKEKRSTGELDHSSDDVINLKNVSHLITEVWWDGDDILGKIKILPTPTGNILKTLLEHEVLVGVSSRGLGSVEQRGELLEVQEDFELICFDFVSNPSNANSWMKPVSLNESKRLMDVYQKYINVNNVISNILYWD